MMQLPGPLIDSILDLPRARAIATTDAQILKDNCPTKWLPTLRHSRCSHKKHGSSRRGVFFSTLKSCKSKGGSHSRQRVVWTQLSSSSNGTGNTSSGGQRASTSQIGRSSPPSRQGFQPPSRSSTPAIPRRGPRIQVSSLLADPHSRYYHLEVVQHPERGAAFENNMLSRVPMSPPLIVRLTVRDPSGNAVIPDDELPFLIAHLSLLDERGENTIDRGPAQGRSQAQNVLYGSLASGIDQPYEDLQGNVGLFFLFPDVSVRWMGRYQLCVTLVNLQSVHPMSGGVSVARHGTVLAEARTRVFDVVALEDFTTIDTRLTQVFRRQGARLPMA